MGWLVFVAALVLAGAAVAAAQETELGGKIQAGDRVVISADETFEGDLYASGGEVRIEGTVTGDLVVAAGLVTIPGRVDGDLIASGGRVTISGEVAGDVRAAGGQITVGGSIGEDLFVAGGQVLVTGTGEVGEDLVFGSGQMSLDGTVEGDVLGTAGAYDRDGTVGGTENVTIAQDEVPTLGDRALTALQRFVSIFVIAALALWLFPRLVDAPAETLGRRPLASLGAGLLGLLGFVVVVVAVIVVATLVAIGAALVGLGDLVGAVVFAAVVAVALLTLIIFLASMFGAPAWVGMTLGGVALRPDSTGGRWAALALGVVVVVALISLPVVGAWLALVVLTLGLGALILQFLARRRAPQTVP